MGPSAFGAQHFEALDAARDLPPTASNITRLSKLFGEEIARWAFLQWELRKRARAKFERADEMLFDREGLEMASHERVARMHAVQFPRRARVADLTCGIGSDLIALALENEAIGFEIDPARVAMARHNLQVHKRKAEVIHVDCTTAKWDFRYAWADPSRRIGETRRIAPEDYRPPLPLLARKMRDLDLGLIKVSPMLQDDTLHSLGTRVDFNSVGGECREAILRVGKETENDSGAWALHVESGRWLCDVVPMQRSVESPRNLLFEADPAAIRAHALGNLCEELQAVALGDSNGYLTGDLLARTPEAEAFAKPYSVHSSGHADEKRIRADLRRLGARIEAVKVRGAKEDPIGWQKKLKTEGSRNLVLALYPVGKSLRYALLEPHNAP